MATAPQTAPAPKAASAQPRQSAAQGLGISDFGGLVGAAQSSVRQEQAAITPILKQTQKAEQADSALAAKLQQNIVPTDLHKFNVPVPAPNPMHAFASAAGIFAVLASAFTHEPAIAAMNGMASAIKARRNNDEAAYKQAYEKWDANTKLAIERSQLQNMAMQTALDELRTNVSAGVAMLKATAAKYQDNTTMLLTEAGLFNQLGEVQAARENAAANMLRSNIAMETYGQEFGFPKPVNYQASDVGKGSPVGPGSAASAPTSPTGMPSTASTAAPREPTETQGPPGTNPGEPPPGLSMVDKQAWLVAHYRAPYPSGKSPLELAIVGRVADFNPNYNAANYAGAQETLKQFDSQTPGSAGGRVTSFNVALSHLNTLAHLGKALQNGEIQEVNKYGQIWAQQTGQTAPVNFDAARNIVTNEVVKAVTASGGGEGDRAAAEATINRAQTWPQLEGVIKTYEELMGGQLRGLKRSYEAAGLTGFDRYLSPRAKTVLANLQSEDEGTSGTVPTGARTITNPETGQKMYWVPGSESWQPVH